MEEKSVCSEEDGGDEKRRYMRMEDGECVDPDAPATVLVTNRMVEQCAKQRQYAGCDLLLHVEQLLRRGGRFGQAGCQEGEAQQAFLPYTLLQDQPVSTAD